MMTAMRLTYPEFYGPSDDDLMRFVTEATIVPDANVLLGLYRLSPDARENALGVLEAPAVSGRLWLPYQAGLEFLRNRAKVAGALDDAYTKARKLVAELPTKVVGVFDTGERHKHSRMTVEATISKAIVDLGAELERLESNDAALIDLNDDPILPRIERLFSGRIGSPPSSETVQKRVETFVSYRAPNLIPPGYEDMKDKAGVDAAGDYLIWAEILDFAAVSDKQVLFLTDDLKNDWYAGPRGKRTGPRPELVREFAEHSVRGYHQLEFARFLSLAREHLRLDVEETTVDEVTEAARAEMRRVVVDAERQAMLQRAARRRMWLEMVDHLKPGDSHGLQLVLEGLESAVPSQGHQRSIVDAILEMINEDADSQTRIDY
jgi:hypothetical protein